MEIVKPGDSNYNSSRRISNARFDYCPSFIYYCENEGDVQTALSAARERKLEVRVRSGGHHHEGMCSGNNVLIIDLSKINRINFTKQKTVWIGPGAKLRDVYKQMWAKNEMLPGGGCGDVCVGGLVQGGGWGLYSRALGLTCDQLMSFRMVLPSGEIIVATDGRSNPHKRLMWAVRGGGGGNFGVITDFHFRLNTVSFPIWQFTLTWDDPQLMHPVMEEWCKNFPNNKNSGLTSFCRLSGPSKEDKPVVVYGYFIDSQSPKALLESLLPATYSRAKSLITQDVGKPSRKKVSNHAEYQPGPPLAALRAMSDTGDGAPQDLSSTCDPEAWFPHKISSCFPCSSFSAAAMQTIVKYLRATPPEANARRYFSLHCLGGNINRGQIKARQSCFPFRDKPFMLQYQAWWVNPNDKPLSDDCLDWICEARKIMKPYTEGAFINFPDKDLVPNPGTPAGLKALLRYYYAQNLDLPDGLIAIKQKYDPGNVFKFPMGIPTQ